MTRSLLLVSVFVLLACGGGAQQAHTASAAPTDDAPTPAPATAPASIDPTMSAFVDAHTTRRAAHCAAPLAWSDDLAQQAQSWADHLAASGCQLEHSDSPYGENLAAGTTGTLSPEDVVQMWYQERDAYRFASGAFSMDTGHFTQLVWLSSERIGCGVASCEDLDVWVCNYDPPGNVEGEFQQNVLPTSCR